MFATLLGALPRPPLGPDAGVHELVEAAVRAQEAAGLEPITDGGFGRDPDPLRAWLRTAGLTDRVVKQAIVGPFSAARSLLPDEAPIEELGSVALELAATGNETFRGLAAAGCPFVEVHEPAAVGIGADDALRAIFRDAQQALLDGVDGTHCSLAIIGGPADAAGIQTILAAPYASLAVDLIAGPDNWRLVAATPGDLGIVCGALGTGPASEVPEVLLWATDYAASTGGRGHARVGVATAGPLDDLTWDQAMAKLDRLAEVIRLAELPGEQRRRAVDPRSVDARSAGLGRYEPRPPRPT